MTTLDVLALNLWDRNGPVGERMTALVRALGADRPDLLALQEVAGPRDASQAHELAEALGYAHVYHMRSARFGQGEGLAIVCDREGQQHEPVYLPHGRDAHHRALQMVDLALGDRVVRVANTHLAWRLDVTDLRTAQAEAIRSSLADWSGPVVLAGDLNDVAGSPPLSTLTEPADGWDPLRDAYAEINDDDPATFDTANPHMGHPELAGRRIDHVLVRGLEVRRARVVLTGEDVVSDHYGVRVRLATDRG